MTDSSAYIMLRFPQAIKPQDFRTSCLSLFPSQLSKKKLCYLEIKERERNNNKKNNKLKEKSKSMFVFLFYLTTAMYCNWGQRLSPLVDG